ncbi:hypothetical protein [Sporosarcina sp. FA9]|uniref:hypothetical protein n=1 Tax=Sporosarcina sp. FA9 TaxID=3413030 RepID=UPI003F659526
MNIKYAMEFTQTITKEHGLTNSKVYLLVLQLATSGRYNVESKTDLGTAESEEEANRIVDSYLQRLR